MNLCDWSSDVCSSDLLNPESPVRIMLSAHADEIGLVVTRITEEGRIQAIERGGIMTHNYPGQKVQICTKKGIVYGVVECSRELLKKETVKVADLLIDIGAVSKEDALQHVSLGDTVVLDSGIRKLLHNRITARDRKSTRLNSSHTDSSRMPSSA